METESFAMRRLIFASVAVPLWVAMWTLWHGVAAVLALENAHDISPWGPGLLTLATIYLVTVKRDKELTFHWLFTVGLACLAIALWLVPEEMPQEVAWELGPRADGQIFAQTLLTANAVFLGLAHLIAATIHDFAYGNRLAMKRSKSN